MTAEKYIKLWDADAVTPEVIHLVWRVCEGEFPGYPIDWDWVWSWMQNEPLGDDSLLDLEGCEGSPALIAIKQEILRLRREL